MVLQLPIPPVPPAPEAVVFQSGMPENVMIATTLIIGIIVLGVILFPLIRAFARRVEGRVSGGTDPMLLDRIAELEHRLAPLRFRVGIDKIRNRLNLGEINVPVFKCPARKLARLREPATFKTRKLA